jgi:ubiquinone/menaquinone biosynthesis C-methylase UbiE
MNDQNHRRKTFNQVATLYDEARPKYPTALIDDIIELSNIPSGGRILEIGCGTGQATVPFARRDYAIDCIELGDNLAEIAKRNLADYPKVTVTVDNFETVSLESASYDLVLSATAFHWIDPSIRFKKPFDILKPNGAIALFWSEHVETDISAPYNTELQEAYRKIAPEMVKSNELPHPDNIPTHFKDTIDSSDYFQNTILRKHLWSVHYDAKTYIKLLDTFSDHRLLDDMTRTRLFNEITSIINTELGGTITKEYLGALYLAYQQ